SHTDSTGSMPLLFMCSSNGVMWDLPHSSEWLMIATRLASGLDSAKSSMVLVTVSVVAMGWNKLGMTGLEIAALAAPSTIYGSVGLRASSGFIAMTVPLHQPPWIMNTGSCEISF